MGRVGQVGLSMLGAQMWDIELQNLMFILLKIDSA